LVEINRRLGHFNPCGIRKGNGPAIMIGTCHVGVSLFVREGAEASLPIKTEQRGISKKPSHQRTLVFRRLNYLDSGFRRNDQSGFFEVPRVVCDDAVLQHTVL